MGRWHVVLCCSLVVLFSCQSSNKHQLSATKMQAVLDDLHVAEAYSVLINQDSARRETERNVDSLKKYYQIILKHHKITFKEFDESLTWYKNHPHELDSMYAKIINDLSIQDAQ